MEALKKAVDRFKTAHSDMLTDGSGYSVGYGLDPDRRGPAGVLVYAMDDSQEKQKELASNAKTSLPEKWEGFPVYVACMSIPRAYKAK